MGNKSKLLSPGELIKQQQKDKAEVDAFNRETSSFRPAVKSIRSTFNRFDKKIQRSKISRVVITPQQYSKEQTMLQEMFDGEKTIFGGTGKDLPKIDGILRSGNGLVNNGDYERRTGRMFGLR